MSPLIGRRVERIHGGEIGVVMAVERTVTWELLVLPERDEKWSSHGMLEVWYANSVIVLPERPPYVRPDPLP